MYKQQQIVNLLTRRHILIAGYGREGRSTHSLLQQLVPSASVDIGQNDEEIRTLLQQASAAHRPYDLIIKSPGIPTMKFEGLCDLSTITSQTDIFLQVYGDQTIAVTGTKGKSTTSTLIWHILNSSHSHGGNTILAGNMGIPLLDIIPQIDEHSIIVAEFSCHQLEHIHRSPHIGLLLNLYQEHLDHYHNYRDYQMAKMQIMLHGTPYDHTFYCTDSPDLDNLVHELLPQITTIVHPYSLTEAKHSAVASMPTNLKGDHNLSNIYAAFQATALAGVSTEEFTSALASFKGLPHRLEYVGTFHDITFYNDSISTIPQATIAAVSALRQVDTLILGGFDRGIDYSTLRDFLFQPSGPGASVRNLVLVGAAGRRMFSQWEQIPAFQNKNTLLENDYRTIVRWCYQHTRQGHICLLSPAAASYDSFTNFEHRGDTFKQYILELK